ncbi:hypothetical protein C0431_05995 [bacterium]|nr:hypothetical protein [bacterium]
MIVRSFFFLPAILLSTLAPACCGIGSGGNPIQFGKQENIVIYDSKTQTEIFIRNARFHTAEPDFAFIAPTPSVPVIYEVDPEIFQYVNSLNPGMSRGTDDGSTQASLEVFQVVVAGGYKATTLKATDDLALLQYLKTHNYKTNPSTRTWLKKYIDKGWYLTAFQVESLKDVAATGVIAMEFKTEEPFNPYYVPYDNRSKQGAGLDLTFISDQYLEPDIPDLEYLPIIRRETSLKSSDFVKIASFLKPKSKHTPILPSKGYAKRIIDRTFPNASQDDISFRHLTTPVKLNQSALVPSTVSFASEIALICLLVVKELGTNPIR